MIELTPEQKAELIRYRHEDQARLLQSISHTNLRIFSGFLTLQLAFGSFLTQVTITTGAKIGFILLEVVICTICSGMLWNNQNRRREVAKTIQNCNNFLGFDEKGAYIPDRTINARSKFWPWHPFFITGIWLSFLSICLILIFGEKIHLQSTSDTTGSGRHQMTVYESAPEKPIDNCTYFFQK